MDIITNYIFWYPILMSLLWVSGALIFTWYRERKPFSGIQENHWPKITFVVPCFNEQDTVEETIQYLHQTEYPYFEIIAVNDGSSDNTGEMLQHLTTKFSALRVIDNSKNRGKAHALNLAIHAARSEYLVCIDSDAILSPQAPFHLIKHFLHSPKTGAVTGNPRVRNRHTLLSKIQIVEYASIIGSIKRTQRIIGKINTVSGVIVAFRKQAVAQARLWDTDMITEDIAISWKLQTNFWDIRFEPSALCWMLVPEKLKGLWKQRVRWAQGGQEVLWKHWRVPFQWKHRSLWFLYWEQICSLLWALFWTSITLWTILTATSLQSIFIWLAFSSFALAFLCFTQLFVALIIDARYDNIKKYYLWAPWYPAFYWILNAVVAVVALPKSIYARWKGGDAIWDSPDRGEKSKS